MKRGNWTGNWNKGKKNTISNAWFLDWKETKTSLRRVDIKNKVWITRLGKSKQSANDRQENWQSQWELRESGIIS